MTELSFDQWDRQRRERSWQELEVPDAVVTFRREKFDPWRTDTAATLDALPYAADLPDSAPERQRRKLDHERADLFGALAGGQRLMDSVEEKHATIFRLREQNALATRVDQQILDDARADGLTTDQREKIELVRLARKVVAEHVEVLHRTGLAVATLAPLARALAACGHPPAPASMEDPLGKLPWAFTIPEAERRIRWIKDPLIAEWMALKVLVMSKDDRERHEAEVARFDRETFDIKTPLDGSYFRKYRDGTRRPCRADGTLLPPLIGRLVAIEDLEESPMMRR